MGILIDNLLYDSKDLSRSCTLLQSYLLLTLKAIIPNLD